MSKLISKLKSKKRFASNVLMFSFLVLFFVLVSPGLKAEVTVNETPQASQVPLDLIFVIDTTGSMWDDIANVKARSTEIVNEIDSGIMDYRIAVVDYRDFPVSPYGGYMDYPYNADLAFSSNKTEIINALQGLQLGWGADWPESVYSAMVRSILTEDLTPWRCEAKKVIILMGDAPPHDPEPFTGYTADSVVEAAQSVESDCGPNSPAIVYSIVIGEYSAALPYFSYISEQTGGKAFTTPNAGTVVETIKEVIEEIEEPTEPEVPVNNAPNCGGAYASLTSIWPPNHKMHAIEILNVEDPDGDPVIITITGITQDEPVVGPGNDKDPDGEGVGTSTAFLRAERDGPKNSRVYKVSFVASDDKGAECEGSVLICVPHDLGLNSICVDDGQNYDSTATSGGKKK